MRAKGTKGTKAVSKSLVAWWIVGGIAALGAVKMFIAQLPSLRREMKLMRM
jgi:hypothetical protein